ncbi:MAG: gliding motility protein GldN [Bacteroidetes bacterium]|nr:gliding motility protein GldN [Bacteroidota bacterium]
MKKHRIIIPGILFLSILFASTLKLSAQESAARIKGLYDKDIMEKTPIPYSHLREADVMWSKKIWRVIDLRKKMNQPLYFPIDPIGDRVNLIHIILAEIKSGTVNAYDADVGDDMTVKITQADIDRKMGAESDSTSIQIAPGVYRDTIIVNEPSPEDVKQIHIQEEWFFDKKHSRMDVRILGIMPIRHYYDSELGEFKKSRICWIYYPDFRNTFANHEIFNSNNDAHRISFDDFFIQRRFSSTIIAESNVYNNRQISDYETGKDALIEAQRIKEWLFNFEHDLWEY